MGSACVDPCGQLPDPLPLCLGGQQLEGDRPSVCTRRHVVRLQGGRGREDGVPGFWECHVREDFDATCRKERVGLLMLSGKGVTVSARGGMRSV